MKISLLVTISTLAICSCQVRPSASEVRQATKVPGLPFISTPEGTLFSFGFDAKWYEVGSGKGTIDDVARGAKSGYRITAIDGEKERRLAHPLIHYVPYVAVAPGRHIVTLQKTHRPNHQVGPNQFSFAFDFEADKNYRLKSIGNIVFIADSASDR